jgi:hypothetical protein
VGNAQQWCNINFPGGVGDHSSQKLLTERNDDNEDNETHIERRIHRMVNYIANRNSTRNIYEPIEFQRIGDEEFMWDNMGSDLWM